MGFGGADKLGIYAKVFFVVQPYVGKCDVQEVADGVEVAGGDDVVRG